MNESMMGGQSDWGLSWCRRERCALVAMVRWERAAIARQGAARSNPQSPQDRAHPRAASCVASMTSLS